MKLASSILLASIAQSLACDLPGCDHPDTGSCGNACCSLSYTIDLSPEDVMLKINATVTSGGPDSLYKSPLTADGNQGFDDLRQYEIDSQFIGQAKHNTINGLYTDSINFNIEKGDGGSGTRVHAFSISEIAGALGDHGQNHWNIVQLMDSMGFEEYSHLDGSCPEP